MSFGHFDATSQHYLAANQRNYADTHTHRLYCDSRLILLYWGHVDPYKLDGLSGWAVATAVWPTKSNKRKGRSECANFNSNVRMPLRFRRTPIYRTHFSWPFISLFYANLSMDWSIYLFPYGDCRINVIMQLHWIHGNDVDEFTISTLY